MTQICFQIANFAPPYCCAWGKCPRCPPLGTALAINLECRANGAWHAHVLSLINVQLSVSLFVQSFSFASLII